jgi:nitronate monooxygenase
MPIPKLLEGRLTLPVIGSPMFIVSGPELVLAQCKAGVVGSFPALNARPKEELEGWIVRIKSELADHQAKNPGAKVAPFAVNQIAHRSNDRVEHDVMVCVKHEVPIIITSLRAPAEVVQAVHGYGGIVLHDVTNLRHAEKAAAEGVDGLILVCAGAGGHAGTMSPFALLAEIRRFFAGTVCLAGAISTGADILAAQAMGADLAYMGTRFIATEEANALPDYKQMVVDSRAADIVYSSLFTGVPGNYLKRAVAKTGLDPENLPSADKSTMNFGSGGNAPAKAWKDIWSAGQGVAAIHDAPKVAELVARMRAEYDAAFRALAANPLHPGA